MAAVAGPLDVQIGGVGPAAGAVVVWTATRPATPTLNTRRTSATTVTSVSALAPAHAGGRPARLLPADRRGGRAAPTRPAPTRAVPTPGGWPGGGYSSGGRGVDRWPRASSTACPPVGCCAWPRRPGPGLLRRLVAACPDGATTLDGPAQHVSGPGPTRWVPARPLQARLRCLLPGEPAEVPTMNDSTNCTNTTNAAGAGAMRTARRLTAPTGHPGEAQRWGSVGRGSAAAPVRRSAPDVGQGV
jgi:hypothetical protein